MKFFRVKTEQGYCIKTLAELLRNNIKTACFEIDDDGIRLCVLDPQRTILISLNLESHKFTIYKYQGEKEMMIGINLNHFYNMVQGIKKKDSIEFYIEEPNSTDLGIKIYPREGNRTTTSTIKIQKIQNITCNNFEGYERPIIIPSGEFQKMCKSMMKITKIIRVRTSRFLIKFSCDVGGVMKSATEFGEHDDSDEEDRVECYNQTFNSEQLTRITKLVGLSANIQIYPKSGLPLLFRSDVGTLGDISIYIKSNEQLEREKNYESEDESDEDE